MSPQSHPGGPLILAVDDEPRNLQVIGPLLSRNGFRVSFALDGARAIALAIESSPDVVLLDVSMPGMDGLEVCRALRADLRTAGIPVIFLTARTSRDDVLAGFRAGAVDYVPKPFHDEELIARVSVHAQLRRLRGLLVVCSHCQHIRTEGDQWERLDHYVARRSDATFSHGLCPTCEAKYYP
jgi:DNA-binding response OmpR family regulator